MRTEGRWVIVVLAVLGSMAAGAAEVPVAVSPGDASKVAVVESRCPTFSWAGGEGAKSYELVVYRVGTGGEEAEAVLRQDIPAPAYSWTPSLDSCLERGGQYAWSARAVGLKEVSEWSAPSLFEVASGPSAAEFKAALQVVQEYLGEETTGSVGMTVGLEESSGAASATPVAGSPEGASAGPAPLSLAMGDSAVQVNGSPVVTVATLEAGCLGRRWLDQGDGTVLDCNTRLIWLKDADCPGGKSWEGAQNWVVLALNGSILPYSCTDYTPETHTDWRLPTIAELCSAAGESPTDVIDCPVANYATSLVDTRFTVSPFVSNADGDGIWVPGDPFVEVGTTAYWSATESTDGVSAWVASLIFGHISLAIKTQATISVWPVRGPE